MTCLCKRKMALFEMIVTSRLVYRGMHEFISIDALGVLYLDEALASVMGLVELVAKGVEGVQNGLCVVCCGVAAGVCIVERHGMDAVDSDGRHWRNIIAISVNIDGNGNSD